MKPLLGIDFGTTTARAALAMGRDVKMVSHAGGTSTIPSVVVFPSAAAGGGPPLVGAAAYAVIARHPERTIAAVKRLLGRKLEAPEVRHHRQTVPYDLVAAKNGDARVRVGRRHHAPQDIAAYVLGSLRAAAERQAGGPVTDAVVAVPGLFDDLQRQAIRDAARIAGLNVLGLLTETSAALLGSNVFPSPRGEDRKVLVYDLGGGSFEVAALVVGDRGAEVVASAGDAFLGGEDFDQRIVMFVCEEMLRVGGVDLRRDRPLLARLKVIAERAKIDLSTSAEVDVHVPAAPGRAPIAIRLTRARLETLTQDLVDRTVWAFETVLREANWSVADVDRVLLTGGQTRMPRIANQLVELVGKAPVEVDSPDALIAMGAARQAARLAGGGRWRGRSRVGSAVTELTCLSLGLESAGGVFARLIPRGTRLPATRPQVISTSVDGQTQLALHLLQGEREMAADNESVARIQIGPLPARPRGEIQIEVEISTDGGGLPRAVARVVGGGEAKPVRMRPSAGLGEAEIVALAALHAGGPSASPALALLGDGGDAAEGVTALDASNSRASDAGAVEGERDIGSGRGISRIDPTAQGGMILARDYYDTLGITRQASEGEIKVAYRKLALRYHPDRNPGDGTAEERFKEVSTAYAVLSDFDKKAHYDRFGFLGDGNPFAAANVASATDFFDAIFGDLLGLGRKKGSVGRDLRYTLEIDFEEAALGCRKTIAFDRSEDCAACRGTGAEGGTAGLIKCGRCGGAGFQRSKTGLLGGRRECAVCGGTGEIPGTRCRICEGAGLCDKRREFDVTIPPRATSGSVQRVAAQGSPGRRGGPAGDLHVVVRVRPHSYYACEGEILIVELPVSIGEAALGAEVEVPVLDGTVKMKIPAGTQSGSVFRVRGKGLPRAGGGRADCHVRVTVETPVELSPEARELLARLESVSGAGATPVRRAFRAKVAAAEIERAAGADATHGPSDSQTDAAAAARDRNRS